MSKEPKFTYPKGLRLTTDESTFVQGALMGVAEGAKKEGQPDVFNTAMELAQRIKHSEMAAEGVSAELQKRLQKGLQRATASGNPELAQRAFENFLTTMVRLHPDPARALGTYVLNYLNGAVQSGLERATVESAREGALQILQRFVIKLEGLTETYDRDDMGKWPEASDLVAYLIQWTKVGEDDVSSGDEPWQGDEHITKAIAAAQAEGDEG